MANAIRLQKFLFPSQIYALPPDAPDRLRQLQVMAFEHAMRGGGVFRECCSRTAGPAHQFSAAVRASFRELACTGRAEGALEGADAGILSVRW